MKRRDFLTLLGGAAAAWPHATRAQQPAMPVIGFLGGTGLEEYAPRLRALRQGLEESDYVEGHNIAIEYRFATDQYDRLPALAADLIRHPVAVIVTGGIPAVLAAKAATATIPIVFYVAGDPVSLGLVASLARPGGNLTGMTALGVELAPKRLELVREMVPSAKVVALLINPTNPNAEFLTREVQAAAAGLGLQLHVLRSTSERDFDSTFETLTQLRAGALVIANDGLLIGRSKQLAALGLRHAVPTIFEQREFAAAGGLLSYGASNTAAYHLAGIYVGRILKGEKPADLAVQQATKVELIINLKTAKALGLTVPLSLLGRADEVIE